MSKTLSSHAAAAKMIRATLKAAYPHGAFTVKSRSYSMGSAVDIAWTDGPTTDAVDALTSQHEQGHCDGMIDLYDYSNVRKDIPQVKYVQTTRTMSHDAQRAIVAYLNRVWGYALVLREQNFSGRTYLEIDPASDQPRSNNYGWQSHDIWRMFSPMSLVCGECGAATLPYDAFCPQCGTSLAINENAA